METGTISIEELWIQLQIRNIKTVKLYRNHHIERDNWYGDMSDVIWKQLLTRQHDGYNAELNFHYEVYTLEIDKVKSFVPIQVKGYEPSLWYWIDTRNSWFKNIEHRSYTRDRIPKNHEIDFYWKNELLLVNQFNDVTELSGDSLLNW